MTPEPRATILIVDDDEVDVELVVRGLRKRQLSFDVHSANDGCSAFALIRSRLSTVFCERLIVLLDLNMPRMNGHEFLSEVRSDSALQHMLVFVLTTSDLKSDTDKAYDRNVAGYFVKSNVNGLLDILGPFADNVQFPVLA